MDPDNQNLDLQNKRDYLYALVLAVYRVTDKFPPEEHLRLKMREEAVNILSHVEHIYAGQESDRYIKFVNSIQTLVHYCEIANEQKWMHESNFEVLKHELFKLRNSFEMPEQMDPIKHRNNIQEASYEVDLRKETPSTTSYDTIDSQDEDEGESRATYLKPNTASALYSGFENVQNAENMVQSRGLPETANSLNSEYGEYAGAPRKNGPGPLQTPRARSEGSPLNDRHETILAHLQQTGIAQVADLSNILADVSNRTIRRDLDKLIKIGKVLKHGKTNGAKYRLA